MIELIIKGKDPTEDRLVDYLAQRCEIDEALKEACQKETKTIAGVTAYVRSQAKEQAGKSQWVMIDDDTVYEWAVHYIIEDSIDCEPKKAEPKKEKSEWKVTRPSLPKAEPTIKVGDNPQLVFDF